LVKTLFSFATLALDAYTSSEKAAAREEQVKPKPFPATPPVNRSPPQQTDAQPPSNSGRNETPNGKRELYEWLAGEPDGDLIVEVLMREGLCTAQDLDNLAELPNVGELTQLMGPKGAGLTIKQIMTLRKKLDTLDDLKC
jgi:hypothetical protein